MRSSKSEDLNIQSNFTSSFLSKSCRLPREQCSVTTANMEQSAKKPKKGFTFSFLRSFICQCKPTGVKKHSAQYYRSRFYLFNFFGLYIFFISIFTSDFEVWASYMCFLQQETCFCTFVKILVVLCFTSLKCPSWNFFSHTQSPWKSTGNKTETFTLFFDFFDCFFFFIKGKYTTRYTQSTSKYYQAHTAKYNY